MLLLKFCKLIKVEQLEINKLFIKKDLRFLIEDVHDCEQIMLKLI